MVTYNKTKTGNYNVSQLQDEINQDATIIPSCTSITATGQDLTLDFASSLSAGEETTLDGIISAHAPTAEQINVTDLPLSGIDKKKLAVHPSFKPIVDGSNTYAVWIGAGDNTADSTDIGGGDLLHFDCQIGTATVTKEIRFNWNHGRVWVHEGYLRFENAGGGDYMDAEVWAEATPLQTSTNLDLELTGNLVKAAAGGPGTGTHGWADATKIVLIPRLYDKDGDWDYDGTNLTANTGSGSYQISNVDTAVQKYFNKIPCCGTTGNYFTMSSDETTELHEHYYLKITAHNISDTNWHAAAIVEIYREKTIP